MTCYKFGMDGGCSSFESFLRIFDILDGEELQEHCASLTVRRCDLANLILAAERETIPLRYVPIFHEYHPIDLDLSIRALHDLAIDSVAGRGEPIAQAAHRLVDALRQHHVLLGHIFWPPSHRGEWHFLYFDQRDVSAKPRHWKHGARLHLMNMVTHPGIDPRDFLERSYAKDVLEEGGAIDLRFVEAGPRIVRRPTLQPRPRTRVAPATALG